MMDIRKIKKLIEMLEESDVSEIEIHEGEDSLRISRLSAPAGGGFTPLMTSAPVAGAPASPAAPG